MMSVECDQAVIIVHQGSALAGAAIGQPGCTDEDLYRSLSSIQKQAGKRAEIVCAVSGAVLDHAEEVWQRAGGAAPMVRAESALDALKKALATVRAPFVSLLQSGDAWSPNKLSRVGSSLKEHDVFCHAMCVGMDSTSLFFPGWDEVTSFFTQTGLSLFHAPLSGMSFRREELLELLSQANGRMPLQWELGSLIIVQEARKRREFSLDILGELDSRRLTKSSDSTAPMAPMAEEQAKRLRELKVHPCFSGDMARRYPGMAGFLFARENEPGWEAWRSCSFDNVLTQSQIVHSPQNLVLLAVFMLLGPGRWQPLEQFLYEEIGFTHECEYFFAGLVPPGKQWLRKDDVLLFAQFGRALWPQSMFLRRNVMAQFLGAGLGEQALKVYKDSRNESGTVLSLRIRCALQAKDEQEVDALAARAFALLDSDISFNDRLCLVRVLATSSHRQATQSHARQCLDLAPYDEELRTLVEGF